MASSAQNLEIFVRAALEKGVSKSEIEQHLLQAEWSADQIKNMLDQFADTPFVVPIPKPRPYLSARDAFQYLLLFTALYFSVIYLGRLLFDFVNLNFPDPVTDSYTWRTLEDDIRLSASFLVTTYPLFLFMSYRTHGEALRNSARRLSLIRRWLTYLTLFVAACFVIGSLVALVYNALGGELTTRFCLKMLIIGVISISVFGFYMWDLRSNEYDNAQVMKRSNVMKRLATIVSAIFFVSLIGAFYALESPAEKRLLRLDERRLRDVNRIDNLVRQHFRNHLILPPDLESLGKIVPLDPDAGTSYEYEVLDEQSYQLCAVFSRPSPSRNDREYYSHWQRNHAAGRQCFKYTLKNVTQKCSEQESEDEYE